VEVSSPVAVTVSLLTVPALPNAGARCGPCGGPLKGIVRSKNRRTNVLVYSRLWGGGGREIKMVRFYNFYLLLIKLSDKHIIFNLKKLKPNSIFLAPP
jgi:hypothetical protein